MKKCNLSISRSRKIRITSLAVNETPWRRENAAAKRIAKSFHSKKKTIWIVVHELILALENSFHNSKHQKHKEEKNRL